MKGVVAGLPEEQRGLTVLVVDTFTLTLLDATVGLAAVVDTGFLGKSHCRSWRLTRPAFSPVSRGLAPFQRVTLFKTGIDPQLKSPNFVEFL